jgi:hypothetical protein
MVDSVTDESNDYFVTRYWALKKVTILIIFLTKLIVNRYLVLTIEILKKLTLENCWPLLQSEKF